MVVEQKRCTTRTYLLYYQYMPFVLVVQGVCTNSKVPICSGDCDLIVGFVLDTTDMKYDTGNDAQQSGEE